MAKVKTELPKLQAPPIIFNPEAKKLKKRGREYTLTEAFVIINLKQIVPIGSILKERNDGYYSIYLPDEIKFFVALSAEIVGDIKGKESSAGR